MKHADAVLSSPYGGAPRRAWVDEPSREPAQRELRNSLQHSTSTASRSLNDKRHRIQVTVSVDSVNSTASALCSSGSSRKRPALCNVEFGKRKGSSGSHPLGFHYCRITQTPGVSGGKKSLGDYSSASHSGRSCGSPRKGRLPTGTSRCTAFEFLFAAFSPPRKAL